MSAAPSSLLGIVAAFEREVRPLLRSGSSFTRLHRNVYSLTVHGQPAVLSVAGAGMENARRAARELIEKFPLRGLVTLGFAGGLVAGLKPGDVVFGDAVLDETTRERFAAEDDLLRVRYAMRGSILSATAVVSSSEQKIRLGRDWGAVAVDMEAAGVARAAMQAGLPFCAVKAITDSAEQTLSIDFNRCQREDKTYSLWAILRQGITNSEGAKDLWRLARSSRQAALGLATALAA